MTVFAQHALAVDHKSRRQPRDAAKAGDLGLALVCGEKAETLRHFFDRGQVFDRVYADGNHLQTFGLVFAVIRLDAWHFRLTRCAPGGPEIDDDDFAFVFGQAEHAALFEVCGFKVGHGPPERQGLRRQTKAGQGCRSRYDKRKVKTQHAPSVGASANSCWNFYAQNLRAPMSCATNQSLYPDLSYSAGRRQRAGLFVQHLS